MIQAGLTLEALAREGALGPCEAVRGELIRLTPPGDIHGIVESRVDRVLGQEEDAGLGLAMVGEVGVVINLSPLTVRGADNVFFLQEQLPYEKSPQGYLLTAPALVVEVLSPNDRATEVQEKVLEYLRIGVRVVWVVDPVNRVVTVHHAEGSRTLGADDLLWAPGVLPGLQAPVSRLFANLEKLMQAR